ncbi:MAG: GHKL domain-containing protein [Clostridiaceae bacterium]|nr:GHKL domain-containing protein [Clostridiaceae bacterium]
MSRRFEPGKTALLLIVINFIQAALIGAVLLYIIESDKGTELITNPWSIIVIAVIAATVAIDSIIIFRSRAGLIRSWHEFRLLENTLAKVEKLNSTLRAQRHDFMNHLQVVHSLIEMDEYKAAAEYIEKVYEDIERVSRIMKTSVAAVNALLQAKLMACEKQGITMDLDVRTQLKDLAIPSWGFCRVLGNLIDNAIYAVLQPVGEKYIRVELYEDLKYHYFRVLNSGEPIPPELTGRIFEAGFTTKGDKGEGMGLAIAKRIVEEHGGSIGVSREGDLTVFSGQIPRQHVSIGH